MRAVQAQILEDLGDLVVGGVDQGGALANSLAVQSLPGEVESLGVPVDADQAGLRGGLEDGGGVAAHAEGGVDVDRAGLLERRGQEVDGGGEQDRDVPILRRQSVLRLLHVPPD